MEKNREENKYKEVNLISVPVIVGKFPLGKLIINSNEGFLIRKLMGKTKPKANISR